MTVQEDGTFTISGLTRGTFVVFARHPHHADAEVSGIEAGSTNVRLQLSEAASVSGVAADTEGRPVTMYTIAAIPPERPGQHNGTTSGSDIGVHVTVRAPNGVFSIAPLPPGSYDLVLTAPDGRAGRIAGLTLAAGKPRRDLRVIVGPACTIRGRVVDAETGVGLADVAIGVQGNREHVHALTDREGAFTIERQVPGRTLALSIRGPRGHMPEMREVTLPDGPEAHIAPIRLLAHRPDERAPIGMAHPGFSTSPREGPTTVEKVAPGSPAARAGIKVGDRVIAIGGRDASQLGSWTTTILLRGPAGSRVQVILENVRGGRRTVELERVEL